MIALSLLLQLVAAAPPPPQQVVVKRGAVETTIPVVTAAGRSSVRAGLLVTALGGSLATEANGHFALTLPHARIDLIDGVPFARIDSNTVPLVDPPELRGGELMLPLQIVTEVIPLYGGGFFYDEELAELRAFETVVRHPPVIQPNPVARETPQRGGIVVSPVSPPVTYPHPSRRLIVVDAGHGGPDHGMTGPIGDDPWFVEKDVTLAVARKLADALRAEGMDVLMTRTTDTLIALSDRGRIANRNKGDVFVSIHVNAPGRSNAAGARERGFETYFLAEAKSEEAQRVERMENESVRFETGANAPKGDPLSFIITDMAQNEHLRESSDLAATIQDELATVHPGPSRGVQQANFAVLRGSYMPAVLVEIGFGTNAAEAAYLSDPDNQAILARRIAGSVVSYLAHYEARVGGTK